MKHWIMGLAALMMIAVPSLAVAALDGPKAKTIDELAAMFDASRCKGCHGEVYDQWAISHHARSQMGVHGGLKDTPLAMAGATPWSPEHPSQATLDTFPCFKCHLPQALTHAEDSVAAEYAQALVDQDRDKVGKLKITCIVCHNNKAIIHRLQEGNPEPHVLYGTRNIPNHPDPVFTEIRQSPVMSEPLFCGQCHGVGVNLEFENPVQCATIYGSYQHAYIPGGGTQSCQDCHLYPKHNGFADHRMLPDWNDTELMSQRLAQSISLDMQAMGYEWLRGSGDRPSRLVVETKIDSTAGHRVPDG
jgi:hypothetical protein